MYEFKIILDKIIMEGWICPRCGYWEYDKEDVKEGHYEREDREMHRVRR